MRKNDICAKEDHWNNHITTLIENHNKTFGEAQELVKCLKRDMDENDSLKVCSTFKFYMFCLDLHIHC